MATSAPSAPSTLQALRALVDVGASDHLLSLAVRELTGTPAQALPASEEPLHTPPAKAAPAEAPLPSPLAAREPSAEGPRQVARTVPPEPAVRSPAPRSAAEILNFYETSGKRSSISFRSDDWAALLAAFDGDEKALSLAAKAAAQAAPPGSVRSKWVLATLLEQKSTPRNRAFS